MTFDCNICFESLDNYAQGKPGPRSKQIFHTPCGHLYHSVCLEQWLESMREKGENPTCPSCRAVFRRNQLVQVFSDKPAGISNKSKTKTSSNNPKSASTVIRESLFDSSKRPDSSNVGPSPVLPCGNKNCLQLRESHEQLMADFAKLEEYFQARKDELLLAKATKESLLDEKNKHLKTQRDQAETIRSILRRPQCKCASVQIQPEESDDDESEDEDD